MTVAGSQPTLGPPSILLTGGTSRRPRRPWVLLAVAGIVVAFGVVWVSVTHTRPSYDAFGWLVWGHQALHGDLNLSAAPSWKPLTFIFSFPYALFGRGQLHLWTVTSSAAALASALFAARIAYRLSGPHNGTRWVGGVAGLVAGVGVLALSGLSHQMLIATSDPMVITLCLAAIDAHLSDWPGLAFALLVLASLGRPEAWPFTAIYAVWAWREIPEMRRWIVVGAVLIPAAWFVVPGLTSKSWFISGDLALKSPSALHGHKLRGVVSRFVDLYDLPMKVAIGGSLVLIMIRRDRRTLVLALAAFVWVAVEVAFAYHGWPAQQRYVMEAGAVLVVLVGTAVGWVLAYAVASFGRRRWPAAAAALALVALLVPVVGDRVSQLRHEVKRAGYVATRLSRLTRTLSVVGGAGRIEACGAPVTTVGYQSTLAWLLNLNVGKVGYKPGREIRSGVPIVLFKPDGRGWQVRPIHTLPASVAMCRSMRIDLGFGSAGLNGAPAPPRVSGRQRRRRHRLRAAEAKRRHTARLRARRRRQARFRHRHPRRGR